jgi:hypothetical protein
MSESLTHLLFTFLSFCCSGCTPAEATAEVLEHASKFNVHRKGNVKRLEAWINGTITSYEMKEYM